MASPLRAWLKGRQPGVIDWVPHLPGHSFPVKLWLTGVQVDKGTLSTERYILPLCLPGREPRELGRGKNSQKGPHKVP